MADPKTMYRSDGTKVTTPRHPSWKKEIYGLYLALVTDPAILLLFPLFFASNYFCEICHHMSLLFMSLNTLSRYLAVQRLQRRSVQQ